MKRKLIVLFAALIGFCGSVSGQISIEAAGSLGIHHPVSLLGVNASYSFLPTEKWDLELGVGFHHAHAFYTKQGASVYDEHQEWVLPLFVRAGFHFGVGFVSVDAGYRFNLTSKSINRISNDDIMVSTGVGVVSGFFIEPKIGFTIAKRFYLAAGVQWLQKKGKYVKGPSDVVFDPIVPAATIHLGIRL